MIRRAWHVLADPPASDFAFFLRNFALPVGAALFLARLLMGPMWGPGLTELVWMVVALKMTRQRDDARRVLAEDVARVWLTSDPESVSRVLQASGHQHKPERPPAPATAPPAPGPAITADHRNEAP